MSLSITYMKFNLLIPTRCETSPHTCTPTVSPSSVSLIHMIVSPSSVRWSLTSCRNEKVEHYISDHKTHKLEPWDFWVKVWYQLHLYGCWWLIGVNLFNIYPLGCTQKHFPMIIKTYRQCKWMIPNNKETSSSLS